MAMIDLSQLAALESLKKWNVDLLKLLEKVPASNPSLYFVYANNAKKAIQTWFFSTQLKSFLPNSSIRIDGPSVTGILELANGIANLRTQLPGILSQIGMNSGEAGTILSQLDEIYNKFISPYKDTPKPQPVVKPIIRK